MIEHDTTVGEVDGYPTVYALPVVPEYAPPEVREGIARRRLTATTGRCPCGASLTLPSRAERRAAARAGRPIDVAVLHEDGCPAPLTGWTP